MRRPGGGDAAFLHRFEQSGLRLRGGAVDFIREQELRKERAAAELELIFPIGAGAHDIRADDVGGHEIGRELDAAKIQIERAGERLDEFRFSEAGHTFE